MRGTLKALLVLVFLLALAGGAVLFAIWTRGISARSEPTWAEVQIARTMRHLAVPRAARDRANPVPSSPEVIRSGLEHFADHCATCHANDGSGDVAIGRSLYPKAPDMRAAPTQRLSDGELFYIIEHGIRLTGMPAWSTGTPDGEASTWHLVHFIRHLPSLTPEELDEMEALNPKSPQEFREEEEIRRFLDGEDAEPSDPHPHEGGNDDQDLEHP